MAFHVQASAVRQISWHDVIVDNGAGSKVVLGQGSFGIVVNAMWDGRRVAVKVITPSDDLDPDEAFEDSCIAADTEADMITKAQQGLDCQELMVKLYGIAKGPLPAEVTTSTIMVRPDRMGCACYAIIFCARKNNEINRSWSFFRLPNSAWQRARIGWDW